MIHKVLCPYCKGTLYEIVSLDGHALSDTLPDLQGTPADSALTTEFITCPKCDKLVLLRRNSDREGHRGFKAAEIDE
jgi:uncharacterized protein YbaR (Trm112 family)